MKKIFLGYPFRLKDIRSAVERGVGDLGKVVVASDTLRALPLLMKIERLIDDADLCLFDLTQHNANVAVELGIALRAGKKLAILYCLDEKLNPKPGMESSVFSDLKGWDSILYHDAAELESELRRLLPEYLSAPHVGIRLTTGTYDQTMRPRLTMSLKVDYALAAGVVSSSGHSTGIRKFGDDKLLLALRNVGPGVANDIRAAMTGIKPVYGLQTLVPQQEQSIVMTLEDQDAYRKVPQFPAITVEYEDDSGFKYRQRGAVKAMPQADGTYYYGGSRLKPPEAIPDYSLGIL